MGSVVADGKDSFHFCTLKPFFMHPFLEEPALFDQPMRLGREERREPVRAIADFFNDYRLHECRHQLWVMVETCLTTDSGEFGEAEERAELLQFCKDLEGLLEAGWLLAKARKE